MPPICLKPAEKHCSSSLKLLRFALKTLIHLDSPGVLHAATFIGGRPSSPTAKLHQQPPALLVVVLIHVDEQADVLAARRHPQGVGDENPLEGLQQVPLQVVAPERLQLLQLGELDVADDGAQVPGAEQGVGLAEELKLPLQGLLLVRGDAVAEERLVLQVLGPDAQADIW